MKPATRIFRRLDRIGLDSSHISPRGPLARSVGVLVSGTVLGQLITVASTPVLTRLYSPADYGVGAVFSATLFLVSVIASLRYEQAIVLPSDGHDAATLLNISCGMVLGTALLWVALVWGAGERIAWLLELPFRGDVLWLLPAGALFAGLSQVFRFWCTRKKAFRNVAVSQVCRSTTVAATQGVAGLASLGAFGLVLGNVAGECVAGAALGLQIWRRNREEVTGGQLQRVRSVLRRYRDFPLYSAPQCLLNGLSQNLPAFLFAAFLGPKTVGLYWFAMRLLQMPGMIIGQAIRQVYFQRATDLVNERKDIYSDLKSLTLLLLLLCGPPVICIVVAGPTLFAWAFGPAWRTAGSYARYLAPWVVAGLVNIPSATMVPILNLQRFFFAYDTAMICLRGSAIAVGAIWCRNDVVAIGLYSLVGTAMNTFLIAYIFRRVRGLKDAGVPFEGAAMACARSSG